MNKEFIYEYRELMNKLLREGYVLRYIGHNNYYYWFTLNRINYYATTDISISIDDKSYLIDDSYRPITKNERQLINKILKYLFKFSNYDFLEKEQLYYLNKFDALSELLYGDEILRHTYE